MFLSFKKMELPHRHNLQKSLFHQPGFFINPVRGEQLKFCKSERPKLPSSLEFSVWEMRQNGMGFFFRFCICCSCFLQLQLSSINFTQEHRRSDCEVKLYKHYSFSCIFMENPLLSKCSPNNIIV